MTIENRPVEMGPEEREHLNRGARRYFAIAALVISVFGLGIQFALSFLPAIIEKLNELGLL